MQIEYIDYLLQTSMMIRYKGRSLIIDHLVIDIDTRVAQIGIHSENGDVLVCCFGIGEDEYSLRKQIDQIQLGGSIMDNPCIDFDTFQENIDHSNGLPRLK